MIGEEQEMASRCACSSPMKSSGICGHSSCNAMAASSAARIGERRQPFAESAIADLIVVLQEKHKGGRRQVGARRAARLAVAMGRRLALIDEAFLQAAGQRAARLVGIVARNSRRVRRSAGHAGHDGHRHSIAHRNRAQMAGGIVVIFEHEMNVTFRLDRLAHLCGHFVEPVRLR